MAGFVVFFRLIVRPLFREPIRTALTVFAVALGVAVVLAIELAGDAATGSFRSSVETLVGSDDLEITAATGVPSETMAALATLPFNLQLTPRIEDYAQIAELRRSVPLIGLDLIGQASKKQSQSRVRTANEKSLTDLTGVWTSSKLGFMPGTKIHLLINDQVTEQTVRGVIEDTDSSDFIAMDLAAADQRLNREGKLDRILVKVPDSQSIEQWQQKLSAALPRGVEVRPQGSRTNENRQMLQAFRWNLRVLSYIALVVGAFLIYNTISVSVVRRRVEIGIIRALGASQRAILWAFLGEAAVFGIIGAIIGLGLGRLMAIGAVRLVGSTVQALYVSSQPAPITLTTITVLFAFAIGIGITVIAALSPASEAAAVPPVEAMAQGRREYIARVHKTRSAWIAVLLALVGTACCFAPPIIGKPLFGYAAAVLFIAASALAIPALVDTLVAISSRTLRRLLGVEALLASLSLGGSLRRTSVLVASLATAIAMMTSVGIMVGSFRQTVVTWMENQLQADLYLRPGGAPGSDRHPTISQGIVEQIAKIPGIAAVDSVRAYEISYEGLPATLMSVEAKATGRHRRSDFLSGRNPEVVYRELEQPGVALVSEPFANKHHIKRGDTVAIPLGNMRPSFRVADIYFDYANERGYIVLDRAELGKYVPQGPPSNIGVYLSPGVNIEAVRNEIGTATENSRILIADNRTLRQDGIAVFDRTFAVTYALEAIAITVAIMGIAGALLALVLDRRREFGLLRFLGASTSQVRKLILAEAGLLGLLANIAGLALGIVLSLVLVYVINKQSFGWTIRFHWPIAVLLSGLSLIYLTTLLAGLYPARVAVRLNPIEVVHEE